MNDLVLKRLLIFQTNQNLEEKVIKKALLIFFAKLKPYASFQKSCNKSFQMFHLKKYRLKKSSGDQSF